MQFTPKSIDKLKNGVNSFNSLWADLHFVHFLCRKWSWAILCMLPLMRTVKVKHLNCQWQYGELANTFSESSDRCSKIFFSIWKWSRFPFDTQSPSGYLVAVILESFVCSYYFFVMASTTTIGIGTYLFLLAPIKDIKATVFSIDKKDKSKKTRIENVQQLCEFVEFHADTKQLSSLRSFEILTRFKCERFKIPFSFIFRLASEFSDMFQPILFSIFTCSYASICTTMLMLQLAIV